MADNGRTEKATPKRRREARQKGQVARSASLVSACVFVGIFFLLGIQIPKIIHNLSAMLQRMLGQTAPAEFTEAGLQKMFLQCAMDVSGAVMVVTAAAIALGIGSNMAQGGLVLSGSRIGLKLNNLNPASGIKKLMPSMAGTELLKIVLIISAVTYTAYGIYTRSLSSLPRLMLLAPADISSRIGGMVYQFAMKCGFCLIVIGVADYLWSRHRFEQSIRMTKQEVKDEAKNAEGNPEIRGKIRRRQREMVLRSMIAAIPKADVVITNPTHFAVALSYKAGKMAAPTVVAKGKGFVALRIREIAAEHKVPLVENKPLARGLFKAVAVGQQIPAELFKAVAEVLAHVYRLRAMRL